MNSFGSRSTLRVGSREFEIYRLSAVEAHGCSIKHLPYSLRILLENLLRREDGKAVKADDVRALTAWNSKSVPSDEIAFMPSRVLLQDFTGVPAVVDLAAMRDAMKALGGDPELINPLQPAELVIDHSVQVDEFGTPQAFQLNAELEFARNKERYAFLRWGQTAFKNFAIVPPDTGIVHQINLEYLARVVFVRSRRARAANAMAYPDTLVGTDSHTTMINGLGVLGWGVGGIEAEAAMLGQPVSMLIPQVVGVRLEEQPGGRLDRDRPGADGDRDAAQEGRGRKVRGVLWTGAGRAAAGRPRDHCEHGSGVRRDLRHLPGGRRNAALSAADRPQGRRRRGGGGLLQGAGTVPYAGLAGGGVHRRAANWIWRRWSRGLRGRSVRRIGWCCRRRGGRLPRRCRRC